MESKTVYCAKHWGTRGIETVVVDSVADPTGYYRDRAPGFVLKRMLSFSDTFATLEEARQYVARERLKKLKKLERELRKYEALQPDSLVPKPRVYT